MKMIEKNVSVTVTASPHSISYFYIDNESGDTKGVCISPSQLENDENAAMLGEELLTWGRIAYDRYKEVYDE